MQVHGGTQPRSDILRRTIATWQPLSKESLTEADAREILDSMVGFFNVLRRIDEKVKKRAGDVPSGNQ